MPTDKRYSNHRLSAVREAMGAEFESPPKPQPERQEGVDPEPLRPGEGHPRTTAAREAIHAINEAV